MNSQTFVVLTTMDTLLAKCWCDVAPKKPTEPKLARTSVVANAEAVKCF